MHCISLISLSAFLLQAQLAAQRNGDELVEALTNRVNERHNTLPVTPVSLDASTLGKLSNVAPVLRTKQGPLPRPSSASLRPPLARGARMQPGSLDSALLEARNGTSDDLLGAISRSSLLRLFSMGAAVTSPGGALAIENGLVTEAWSKLGGGPPDLYFPDEFLGTWLVFSKLNRVDLPQGEDMVKDIKVVERARGDIGEQQRYPLRFVRNSNGKVVFDRAYNTRKLAETLAGKGVMDNVEWSKDDPNILSATIRDGRVVNVRVTKRSEQTPEPNRIETSELSEVVFESGVPGVEPKVKSERTFTKYKFRPIEEAGDGPAIVATQVVYDYLTSFDDKFLKSEGKAVTEYSYSLQMFPASKTPNWKESPLFAAS